MGVTCKCTAVCSCLLSLPLCRPAGIMAILFSGIVMSHYTHHNLSPVTQILMQQTLRTVAFLCGELSLGVPVCVPTRSEWASWPAMGSAAMSPGSRAPTAHPGLVPPAVQFHKVGLTPAEWNIDANNFKTKNNANY